MQTAFEFVTLQNDGAVARIVLRRPPLNILNLEMIRELNRVVPDLRMESGLRALVIAAEGAESAGVWRRGAAMSYCAPGGRPMSATGRLIKIAGAAAIAAIVVATWAIPAVEAQRDRGFNQPGAVGNRGGAAAAAATPAGYGGSARQVRVSDPGVNQPGAAGNRR